jgi:negative regulator of flagellin synthesis FlgM
MKVTDKTDTANLEGVSKSKTANKKSQVGRPSVSGIPGEAELGAAKVKLSDRAQDMQKVRDVIKGQPDVDEAKIAKFKSLIANGKYKVDAAKVADKMVDEHAYGDLLAKDE